MGIYKDASGAVLPDSSPSGLPPDGRALVLAQFPLHRLGSHEDDTLEQGLTVVKVTVAEGS